MPLWIDTDGWLDMLALAALIVALLIAFDQFDRWRLRRRSPVDQIMRRHFGGV